MEYRRSTVGVPSRVQLKILYRKENWKHFTVLPHAFDVYRKLRILERVTSTLTLFGDEKILLVRSRICSEIVGVVVFVLVVEFMMLLAVE